MEVGENWVETFNSRVDANHGSSRVKRDRGIPRGATLSLERRHFLGRDNLGTESLTELAANGTIEKRGRVAGNVGIHIKQVLQEEGMVERMPWSATIEQLESYTLTLLSFYTDDAMIWYSSELTYRVLSDIVINALTDHNAAFEE